MNKRTTAIVGVLVMSVLLTLYFVFVGIRAIALLNSGTAIAITMGVALLVLPLIGAWALGRELLFGWRSTRLIDLLDEADQLPDDLGEAGPTGKADRGVADTVFPRYQREAEEQAGNWRAWARLGVVYDACGDRKRARAAIREAISLERDENRRAR